MLQLPPQLFILHAVHWPDPPRLIPPMDPSPANAPRCRAALKSCRALILFSLLMSSQQDSLRSFWACRALAGDSPIFFSSKVVPFSCLLIFCWRLWGNVSIKPPCCLGAPGLGNCLVCSTHAVTHFYGVCLWLLCKERKTGGLGGKASSLLYKQTKRIVVLGFGKHLN